MIFLTALVLGLTLFACSPKRKSSPGSKQIWHRSQLPDHQILDLEEEFKNSQSVSQFADIPFSTSYVDINISATEKKSFVHVAIPDSQGDQKASGLIDSYWYFSKALVAGWATVNTGIIIDLCSNGEGKKTADFYINAGGSRFPLMIVWDDAAAERVKFYFHWLEIVPGVTAASNPILKGDYLLQLNNINSLINRSGFVAPSITLPQTAGCFR